jgi:hypothetical protein
LTRCRLDDEYLGEWILNSRAFRTTKKKKVVQDYSFNK